MCKQLAQVATQWSSGATRDSNRGRRVLILSALTTTPPSHTIVPCRVSNRLRRDLSITVDTKIEVHLHQPSRSLVHTQVHERKTT